MKVVTTVTVQECVENGMRLLDSKWPGWEGDVNLPRLWQASGADCVVAQVAAARGVVPLPGMSEYSPYYSGMVELGLWEKADSPGFRGHETPICPRCEIAVHYGFSAALDTQEEWRARISARRALQQAEASYTQRERWQLVGALMFFVLCVLLGWPGAVSAQVKQSPRGIDFTCPITQYTGPANGGVPTGIFVDFYACDSQGANCAPSPQFTAPSPTVPLSVSDPRLGHLPDGTNCEINFSNLPYPVGQVFIAKGRYVNQAGTADPSAPSEPFTTPQPRPLPPANWKVVP